MLSTSRKRKSPNIMSVTSVYIYTLHYLRTLPYPLPPFVRPFCFSSRPVLPSSHRLLHRPDAKIHPRNPTEVSWYFNFLKDLALKGVTTGSPPTLLSVPTSGRPVHGTQTGPLFGPTWSGTPAAGEMRLLCQKD